MNGTAEPLVGLRVTLRHQMILVGYLGVLSSLLAPVFRRGGEDAAQGVLRVVLLGSPWVAAGLLAAFDRRGPLRDYLVAGSLFAFYPALTAYLDLSAGLGVIRTGVCPGLGGLALFNAMMLAASAVFYARMRPAVCPGCSRRSIVPLIRLAGKSQRFGNTRWCATCGGQFWRDRSGAWRVERRQTWVPRRPAPARHHLDVPAGSPA